MLRPADVMIYRIKPMDMRWFVRGLVSALLGLSVGFSVAFIATPDPTGLLPVVVGLILSIALTAIFYAGIDRVAPSESE